MARVYLDHNATTPVDPAVFEEMVPYLRTYYGNPSSGHLFGREARQAVDRARDRLAGLLGCDPGEIVFTGGGTESNNLAIKGAALAAPSGRDHLITVKTEHPAVTNTCRFLESRGFHVTYLPVNRPGLVDPEQVREAITPRTFLITIMHANNETGTIQPIEIISDIAREHGVLLHTDAAQSVGKVKTRVGELGVDLMTVAGHKFYGPKGVGALFVRRGVRLEPLIHGAGHEFGLRAGTENVSGMAGLGKAAEVAASFMSQESRRLLKLRQRIWTRLREKVPGITLNGHPELRLPNTLNVSFPGVRASELLSEAHEVVASTGAACHDRSVSHSSVLTAMGLPPSEIEGAIRLSLGRWNTEDEINLAAEMLASAYARIRNDTKAGSEGTVFPG